MLVCLIVIILFPAFTIGDNIINETNSDMNNKTAQNSSNNSDTISNKIATNENKKILLESGDGTDFSTIQEIQNERGVSWSIVSYRDNPKSPNKSKIYSYNNSTDNNLTNKYLVVTENGSFVLSAEVNSESNNKMVRLDSKVSDSLNGINQRWTLESYKNPTSEQNNPKIKSIFIEYKDTNPSVEELNKSHVDVALITESSYNKNRWTIPVDKAESKQKTVKLFIDNYSSLSIIDNSNSESDLIISLKGVNSDLKRPYTVKIQVNLEDGTTDTITTKIKDKED
jgi:hypothetical protein